MMARELYGCSELELMTAVLNIVQALALIIMARRSRRFRRADRHPGRWVETDSGQWIWSGGSGMGH